MQTVRQPPPGHHPAGEFVDQNHFAVANDVILVLGEQLVRPQRLIDVVHDGGRFGIIQRLPLGQDAGLVQRLFHELVPFVGEGDVARFFVQGEVFFGHVGDQLVDGDIQFATGPDWAPR